MEHSNLTSKDYFKKMNCKLIKTISDGEEIVYIYQDKNGDVRSSDGNFFANINDNYFDDALEEFECGWREVHWNHYQSYSYVDCDEVDDYMDDDIKDWY